MKAYVLHGVGDLRYEEAPRPEPRPGWVLVRVLAAGICSSDIPRIFVKGTYHFPTIPGHEFCGVVERAADPEGETWIGKRVGVYPLIPCKKCPSCIKEQYETCENYDYLGSRRDGGFAEYAAVPVWNLIRLPDQVSDLQGALLEPASVALHAVRRLGDLAGRDVCVVGTGAIGLLAGQWAKLLGAASVTVKGRNAAKREIARQCGLTYTTQAGKEFDCVVEAVGTPAAIAESITLTKPGGHLALLGNPSGEIPLAQDVYWRILRKQLTLSGSWNSSFQKDNSDWSGSVQAIASGRIQVESIVTHVLDASKLDQGLTIMRDAVEPYGKVIVRSELS